jgi:hypothetical protein
MFSQKNTQITNTKIIIFFPLVHGFIYEGFHFLRYKALSFSSLKNNHQSLTNAHFQSSEFTC